MTRVWYDTEFLEDGRTIDLISVGLVAEDGRELYCVAEEVSADPLYSRIRDHHWLMNNVVPHLPLRDGIRTCRRGSRPSGFNLNLDDNRIMPRRMIRNAVREFLLSMPDLELWAWYGAYDHVALAQLFGSMIALPKGIPMYTHDLKQETDRLGNPPLPERAVELDGAAHDALADARWARRAHLWLLSQTHHDAAPARRRPATPPPYPGPLPRPS